MIALVRAVKMPLILVTALGCIAVVAVWWMVIGQASGVGRTASWLLRSHDYKAEVLAQPNSANGELKHVEWDVSGWGPVGPTIVYLVLDPTDSLSAAAKSSQPGLYSGIPCEVARIQRLESHWYAVTFYTEESWGKRNRLNYSGFGG